MKNFSDTQPLRVALLGLDARGENLFGLFVQGPARGVCQLWPEDQADVAIVDLDGPDGSRLWADVRKRFRGPLAVMSVREQDLGDVVWIRKPLTADHFRESIERIRDQLARARAHAETRRQAQNESGRSVPSNSVPDGVTARGAPEPVPTPGSASQDEIFSRPARAGEANRNPIRIAVLGVDPKSHNLFGMFVQGPVRGLCSLVGERDAEVAIVNGDGDNGLDLLSRVQARFEGPVALMSARDHGLADVVWIRKPLTTDGFRASIDLLRDQLAGKRPSPKANPSSSELTTHSARMPSDVASSRTEPPAREPPQSGSPVHQEPDAREPAASADLNGSQAAGMVWTPAQAEACCGDIEDALYLDPARRAETEYDPGQYLQGLLEKAYADSMRLGVPIVLDDLGQKIIVLPIGKKVYSELSEKIFRPLCVLPMGIARGNLRVLNRDEPAEFEQDDPRLHDYYQVLWLATLWASRGRVPRGTDPDAPVRFRHWPNFTRLLIPPHAMQIAALWTREPVSLIDTARMLGIPYRYVFTMYSGCVALGLVERRNKPRGEIPQVVPQPVADRPVSEEKRSFLSRLLRKLTWGR